MAECKFSSELTVRVRRSMMDDQMVAEAAWVSSGFESNDQARVKGVINFLVANRHGTPFEHNSVTFRVKAPIFVWREFMRHRIGISYNEESGRYKQLEPEFYIPATDRNLVQIGKVGAYQFVPGEPEQYAMMRQNIREQCIAAYEAYESMLADDIAKEVARMCLPVNIYSSAYVTMNARSIMNFLGLRTKSGHALFPSFPMWEINNVADQIEAEFARLLPLTHAAFDSNGRVAP